MASMLSDARASHQERLAALGDLALGALEQVLRDPRATNRDRIQASAVVAKVSRWGSEAEPAVHVIEFRGISIPRSMDTIEAEAMSSQRLLGEECVAPPGMSPACAILPEAGPTAR
jgi:hypothetical protein